MPDKSKAVVLARFSALGDVAMTVPVVYDLCAAMPDTVVVFVTRGWMANMMVNAPGNLRVVKADLEGRHRGVAGMRRLVRELCAGYDVESFIDLHDVIRTRMMRFFFRFAGVRSVHIDKGRRAKKQLAKQGAKAYAAAGKAPLTTTIERYRDTVRHAGFAVAETFAGLFERHSVADGIFRVGIAPFAAHPGKVYPLDKMAKVVEAFAAEPDTEVYLFGAGDSECRILSTWAADRANVVNMAERRAGLAAELELMSRLDVMLAMDSGNMHLAAIAGTPRVISVWGATHPDAGFAPFRANVDDIVSVDMDCRPCSVYGNRPCRFGDLRCMNNITPEQIIHKIKDVRH